MDTQRLESVRVLRAMETQNSRYQVRPCLIFYVGYKMELNVCWVNATRLQPERNQIEQAYKARLMALFGTVAAAAEAKGHWHRCNEPPIHHWTTYNKIAHIEATSGLLPSERQLAHFTIRFEE